MIEETKKEKIDPQIWKVINEYQRKQLDVDGYSDAEFDIETCRKDVQKFEDLILCSYEHDEGETAFIIRIDLDNIAEPRVIGEVNWGLESDEPYINIIRPEISAILFIRIGIILKSWMTRLALEEENVSLLEELKVNINLGHSEIDSDIDNSLIFLDEKTRLALVSENGSFRQQLREKMKLKISDIDIPKIYHDKTHLDPANEITIKISDKLLKRMDDDKTLMNPTDEDTESLVNRIVEGLKSKNKIVVIRKTRYP
jgi:hypothetical protein